MKKETRTVVYDDELRIEAYRFEGIVQPFPSHFHEQYVIGFVEKGERVLSCRDREYAIEEGSIVLFNPGDSHACVQSDGRTFDYTNYHLSSILTDNGYVLKEWGVVGEWNITEDAGTIWAGGFSKSLSVPLLSKGGEILQRTGGLKMDLQNEKCVMVIDENLPLGIIANTAAIMGITLGKQMPEVVGADVYDKTGNGHLGIIEFPVPILKGNVDVIKAIREKLYEPEFSELTVVDFSDLAQGCKTYDEFIEKMKDVSETELNYFGIAICGAKKKVNKLTGSMALLR